MGGGGSKEPTHEVVVVTGDEKGASARNITVSMVFTDDRDKTLSQTITDYWKNDFKKGKHEKFQLDLLDLGKVVALRVTRDDEDEKEVWYIDRIEVKKLGPEPGQVAATSIFPVLRWIEAKGSLKLSEYDSFLPQYDPNLEQREKELRAKREVYMLSGKILGAPPQVEILPKDETFSNSYLLKFGANGFRSSVSRGLLNMKIPRFTSLEDIESIYGYKDYFPEPRGLKNWKCDIEFGHQKLAGCNPVLIELCKQIPIHLAIKPDTINPRHLENKSLQQALDGNRMYIIDLRYLADIECSEDRKLPGPTCLFYQRDNSDLVPVAIQLMPEPAEGNPVFTPSDPEYTWLAAKMWFNLADCSHHQSATHLGFTHLLMESVAVCANRRLSPSHPMYKLLAPHFLYILAINSLALRELVDPGGWVDTTMQIGRAGMFNIIHKKWKEWNFKEYGNLLNDLKRRGVDMEGTLPNYHYRDDAKLLWQAIGRYVTAVVNGVYDTPEKLQDDSEIHAWVKELSESAQFDGITQDFTKTDELIELITVFIFISSVGHAAANFEQYDQYAFPPNYPSIIHGERPKNKDILSEQYIVDALPSKEETLDVMEITRILSEKGTNSLGYFEQQYAYDENAVVAVKGFQADLKQVTATIKQRNDKRERKYPYLSPNFIPNAISI